MVNDLADAIIIIIIIIQRTDWNNFRKLAVTVGAWMDRWLVQK